jgi:hypothetical protein
MSVLQAAENQQSGSKQKYRAKTEESNALQALCPLTFTNGERGFWLVQQCAGMSKLEGKVLRGKPGSTQG